MTLKNFFKSILKMPYYKNYAAASGAVHNINKHEKAVEDQLLNHGFTEANLPLPKGKKSAITKAERNAALENPKILLGIKNNSYVSQPCGTHDSPDFIVNYNNKLYFIECKSGNNYKPVFNSGLPKPSYIYIFCSKKLNETTVFMGKDIVNDEQRRILLEHKKKQQELDRETNRRLKDSDSLGRGIDYYTRPMYNQSGNKEKTNYFTHQNRTKSEQRVLKYVS